jgi:hypothetical protein
LQPRHLADVLDHARARDARGDVGRAAHHRLFREELAQALDRLDAVLERDHLRLRADDRLDLLGGALGVPELHAEHHDVDRAADLGGLLDRAHLEVRVAVRALDRQAVLLHRREVPPPRDESHLVSALLQAAAEIAADAARPHACDFHTIYPGSCGS